MNQNAILLNRISFWTSVLGVIAIIFDFGFSQSLAAIYTFTALYFIILVLGTTTTVLRYVEQPSLLKTKVIFVDLFLLAFAILSLYILIDYENTSFSIQTEVNNRRWLKISVLLTFIRLFSEKRLNYKRTVLDPAQLFILSFIGLVLIGSFLLMLPKASKEGLSFIDALFTSTSAVCVTGLIVLDTATDFTLFGQVIILLLIQVGGLGILTFASYFGYFFKGGSTYENQLALSDMTSSKKLGEVFSTLKYIIQITFSIELTAAVLIYFCTPKVHFQTHFEHIFFSVFHAISAFCNAGFSTLTNSLYEVEFRFNYLFQLVIITTFVFGSLGFPIVVNTINYIGYKIKMLFRFKRKNILYRPWVLNLSSRITLTTTFSIIIVAVVLFYIFESDNTLKEHNGIGKWVTALFGATTPRTAGFNSIDTSALKYPTFLLVIFLMWVGASPYSTGGGIKTSTFAIAILNILSLAKGKSRIEVYRREIALVSVRRAFAIISLSVIVIGLCIALLTIFDGDKGLKTLAFESFSAYSTVGLSLGVTSQLSSFSKIVLVLTMFVGRVSMLTIVIALVKKVKHKNYRYPNEEIIIN